MNYTVYTDGAYSAMQERGGVGFVILNSDGELVYSYGKAIYKKTTNQRMEILAAILALEAIQSSDSIEVISDSAYVVRTIMEGWKRKCNNDLWDRLDAAIAKHPKVEFKHIRGHQGNKYNEICDYLATHD